MGAAGLAGAAGFPAPAISQGAAARTLRFRSAGEPRQLRPDLGHAVVVRNASALVWDTLYGVNEQARPAAADGRIRAGLEHGLTWTFKLRPGLRFHDGEPVRARTWSRASPAGRRATRWA